MQHSSPSFDPHVTLFTLPSTSLSTDQLVSLTRSVVESTKDKVALQVGQVTVGDTFHQSIFLTFSATPELTSLRTKLLKALRAPSSLTPTSASPHFPHASLYYGSGTQEDKHHVVMQMMDARVLDIQFDGGGNSNVEVTGLPKGVEFEGVWVVDTGTTKGPHPSEWKLLHKETFGASQVAPPTSAGMNGASSASATMAANTSTNGASSMTTTAASGSPKSEVISAPPTTKGKGGPPPVKVAPNGTFSLQILR